MVGEAEISNLKPHQPHNSSLHTRRRSGGATLDNFPEGSIVEVRTDEEGFKFVYFTATVIPASPSSESPKTNSKRKSSKKSGKDKSIGEFNKPVLHVEYHNLLANDDGADRLKEGVDISFVRPVPPVQETCKGLELGDVVDAFYKDGWWQGVVNKVFEGGERFIVTFEDPPDVLEFGLEELRYHWDWVDGTWIRPKKKQSMKGLMFDVGRKVEVSFDRDDSQDAWFPATIHEDLGNGVFRVEYTNKKGDAVKTTVDSHHIRPCPPLLKDKNFVLLEKVDAYFDYCWWSGVITKELENYNYIVFFKPMKQDREVNQSKLRPHMDWKEGKWFTSSQDASMQSSDDGVHEHHKSGNTGATVAAAPVKNAVDGKGTSDGKSPTSLASMKGHVEQLTLDNQNMSHMTKFMKKRKQNLTESGVPQSQPPKKLKEGIVGGTKSQNRKDDDGPNKEVAYGFLSPESESNTDTSPAVQATEDQPSFDQSWDTKIQRKQRNARSKLNSGGMVSPSSDSMKTSTPTLFDSGSLDIRGEVLGASENDVEELPTEGIEVPIVIGLPCFDTGSPGVSGGKKSQSFKIKEVATIVNDKEHPLIDSSAHKIKDKTQIGPSSERRKRGRPRRAIIENPQTPVPENPQNGDTGSGDLRKEGDLQRNPEVEVIGTDATMSDLKKIESSKEKAADGLAYPKTRRVRTMKRTSPGVPKEKGTKESELGENLLSMKKGKKMSAVQVQDTPDASGWAMMEVDPTVEVQDAVEVPSTEFDNEPLSRWIVELNSPSLMDSSRRSPEGAPDQCRVNGEKQKDAVVINEGSETLQPSASVDKNSTLSSEKQVQNGSQALALADKDVTERSDKESLPFVKNISLWNTIESMEVFQKIPQNPHFKPLEQVGERSYREGLALGLMVTFASLVETTSKLQLSDPRSAADEMIATVGKLNEHGFDVGVLHGHISQFLEVKDKEEKLVDEVNNLNDKIVQRSNETARIEDEMRELNEQIRKLQEKHSVAELAKEKMAGEVSSLQLQLEKTRESIENLRRNFKGVVSAIAPRP